MFYYSIFKELLIYEILFLYIVAPRLTLRMLHSAMGVVLAWGMEFRSC